MYIPKHKRSEVALEKVHITCRCSSKKEDCVKKWKLCNTVINAQEARLFSISCLKATDMYAHRGAGSN